MLGQPARVVPEGVAEVVVHSVRLDVGFRIDVEAETVAQLIEKPRKRVVACADGVDVVALHQGQVFEQQLAGDVMP